MGLTCALVIIGQWLLDRNLTGEGLLCYLLGVLSFEFLVLRPQAAESKFVIGSAVTRIRLPVLAFTSLVLLFFVITGVRSNNPSPAAQWIIFSAWILNILVFSASLLIGLRWRPPSFSEIQAWLRSHWMEVTGIALIVLAALILRLYDLSGFPYPPYNDEGQVGVESLNFVRGINTNFFGIGWSSQPNISFMQNVPAILLFQNTIFAVRLGSAIEGTLTILFLYLLVRQEFGVRPAFLAAGILTALPVHLQFSRSGFNNIIPGFFAPLILWLILRAIHNGRLSSYLWAGLVSGFTLYTYLGSRLAAALAVGLLIYLAITRRHFLRRHISGLIVFLISAVVVMAPMITDFLMNPDHFMARMNGESIFANNWLPTDMASTGQNLFQVLVSQLAKSSLVFITGPASMGFFNSPQPYFPAIIAVFLVLGMGYLLFRLFKPAHLVILAWFWSVIIFAGVLTIDAPASQRLVMSLPAAALFAGLGIHLVIQAFEKLISARVALALCLLIPLVASVQEVQFYFVQYRHGNYLEDSSNEIIIESINQLKSIGPGATYFLLGGGRIQLSFANYPYLLPDTQKFQMQDTIDGLLANYRAGMIALFVSVPEQRSDLEAISQRIPGGQWLEFKRKTYPDQVLYYSYLILPSKKP